MVPSVVIPHKLFVKTSVPYREPCEIILNIVTETSIGLRWLLKLAIGVKTALNSLVISYSTASQSSSPSINARIEPASQRTQI